MKQSLFIIFLAFLLFSCKNKTDNTDTNIVNTIQNEDNLQDENNQTDIEYLSIEGEQIWVRSEPTTGDVVLKLDEGTKCELIEKGKQETINGVTDYWYKINYHNQEGWVFGSQTSVKQSQSNANTQIEDFLSSFLADINTKDFTKLEKYFIDDNIYELYNPGVLIYVEKVKFRDAKLFSMFKFSASSFKSVFSYKKAPIFDMELYEFPETGYFINNVVDDDILTVYAQYSPDYYDETQLSEMGKAEKNISHKLLITDGDGIIFYFGKINGNWKIIAVDVSTNDA